MARLWMELALGRQAYKRRGGSRPDVDVDVTCTVVGRPAAAARRGCICGRIKFRIFRPFKFLLSVMR